MADFSNYKKTIMTAAHNDRIRLALSRAIGSYRSNRNNALTKFPHTIKMAEEIREMRARTIGDMEVMAQEAIEAIESNKGHGYIARTAEDALKIIGRIQTHRGDLFPAQLPTRHAAGREQQTGCAEMEQPSFTVAMLDAAALDAPME